MYKKVGLYNEEDGEFFKNENSKTIKYGYCRIFAWENLEEVRENWVLDSCDNTPNYVLKKEDLKELEDEIRGYIINEVAKFDLEKKLDGNRDKMDGVIMTILKQTGIIDKQNEDSNKSSQQKCKSKSQESLEEKKIDSKLEEIKTSVNDVDIEQATENPQNDITDKAEKFLDEVQNVQLNDFVKENKIEKILTDAISMGKKVEKEIQKIFQN